MPTIVPVGRAAAGGSSGACSADSELRRQPIPTRRSLAAVDDADESTDERGRVDGDSEGPTAAASEAEDGVALVEPGRVDEGDWGTDIDAVDASAVRLGSLLRLSVEVWWAGRLGDLVSEANCGVGVEDSKGDAGAWLGGRVHARDCVTDVLGEELAVSA